MESNEAIKLLKGNKKGLIMAIVFILIAIILIFFGASLNTVDESKEAKDYGNLISKKEDKQNDYVSVNISYLPYLFASIDDDYGGKKFYIIFDEEGYPYIARLTDKTYDKLEKQFDNKEEINLTLKGYLYNQPKDLKEFAIDAHKEIFEDSEINNENYNLYFGKTYFDETLTPSTTIEAISIGLGAGLIILSIFIIIFYIVTRIRFRKNINKYSRDELIYELSKKDTIYYSKANICLTNNYIISTLFGLDIYKYEDILWLYNENRRYNFISIGKYLIARTKKKKIIQLAYSYRNEKLLIEIMKKIKEKNDKILLGFNKENQTKYNELVKNK